MVKKLLGLGLIVALSCSPLSSSSCPKKEVVVENLKRISRGKIEVVAIKPLKEISGLCEVVLKSGINPVVLYTDKGGRYILTGRLIDTKERVNLTYMTAREYAKVDEKTLKELSRFVDFKVGNSKKYVYYIADPECPFCKRTTPLLERWAKEKGVEIRVILFPLIAIHPGAFHKSVAIICDNKGFEGLKNEYDSKNQCRAGVEKVKRNISFLANLGVSGTPTLIGYNGKVLSGMPTSEEVLDELIR